MVHHIDTYYYSISLVDDVPDSEDNNLLNLIDTLEKLKEYKQSSPNIPIDFYGLDVTLGSFSIYQYHLQMPECFDVFIAKNIMNDDTPRICVQLRSRMLVLEGEFVAIEKSYKAVLEFLNAYGLKVASVLENRIDYAFHTNLVQKGTDYLTTEYLASHLKTKLRTFTMHGDVGDEIEVNTLWLGTRKSNNIFFRFYNKSKEVIQQNYKSFFIERWFEKKLINKYDRYVYRRAFELKSYVTGILVARCEWYIQYGHDDELKDELKKLIRQCYVNSDNAPQIEKKLKGVLPGVTIVNNIEFQTKRAFYHSCDKFIKEHRFIFKGIPELKRVYKILYLRKEFLDYLTTKGVRFVENKDKKNEHLTDWWQRIHSCKLEYTDPAVLDLYRQHDTNVNSEKSKRKLLSSIARYCEIINIDNDNIRSFNSDVHDVLSSLNDNDLYQFNKDLKEGKLNCIVNFQYPEIQMRTQRQLKPIFKKMKKETKKEGNKDES